MNESTSEHAARTDRAIERQDHREEVDRVSGYVTDLDEARGVIDRLERERDQLKAALIKVHKDYGCEIRDPWGTIWDHAATLQAELASARAAIKDFLQWYRDITNHGVYIDHDRERVWREAGK